MQRFFSFKNSQVSGGENTVAPLLEVDPYDRLEIVCPKFSKSHPYEYLKIYMVSDMAYLSCQLESKSREFVVCDKKSLSTHRAVFRTVSPLPNAFEYSPGHSYYLITTSNGTHEGINNSRGGLCSSKNLRYEIYIRPVTEETQVSTSEEEKLPAGGIFDDQELSVSNELLRARHYSRSRYSTTKKASQSTPKFDESLQFISKHGIDMERLKYVQQLANEGAEGSYSFQQLQNNELTTTLLSPTEESPSKNFGLDPLSQLLTANRFGLFATADSLGFSGNSAETVSKGRSTKHAGSKELGLHRETPDAPIKTVFMREDYLVDENSSCMFV